MLKKRIITALILLIIVIVAIFFLPTLVFGALCGLLLLGACWEWGGLLSSKGRWLVKKLGLCLLVIAAYFAAINTLSNITIFALSAIIALWAFVAIILQERGMKPAGFQTVLPKIIACLFLLIPTFIALTTLRLSTGGAPLLFFALTLVFINDTAAYFSGRWLGKKKLAPSVSPKKTWEGCLSGITIGVVWSILITSFLWYGKYRVLPMAITTGCTLIAAVIGDLFISVLKRQMNIKDTGSILPGHGGLLDRLDAVIMALPVFALCANCFGLI